MLEKKLLKLVKKYRLKLKQDFTRKILRDKQRSKNNKSVANFWKNKASNVKNKRYKPKK